MGTKNYIAILIESLRKKITVLDELIKRNEEQSKLLDAPVFDSEAFDRIMDEKAVFITDLRFLDTGFEAIYDRAKETLTKDRASHVSDIRDMQLLITAITQKSTAIEASERRNDVKFKNRFRSEHQRVRQSKNTMQVASGYYKSMTGTAVQDARYMDQKF